MLFRVGPFVYRVEKVAGYVQHEGEDCLGLCDNDAHVLYVSQECSTAQQIQVLCHEYMEAWLYHFGQGVEAVGDKEQWCDLFGLAMTQFVTDLMHTLRVEGPALFDSSPSPPPPPEAPTESPPSPEVGPSTTPAVDGPSHTDPKRPKRARPARVPIRSPRQVDPDGKAEEPPPPSGGPEEADLARWRAEVMAALSAGYRGPSAS